MLLNSNGLKLHLNYPPLLEKILKIPYLKWPLKLYLNYLPWLEKILNGTYLKWPKIAFKLFTMVGETVEFYLSQMD